MYPFCEQIHLHVEGRISPEDAQRQERTAREILRRLSDQPGLILADEVGMGKTFVALAVATSVAFADRARRPIVVMTPSALKEKWPADFALFAERCLDADTRRHISYGQAERADELLKLLDDPAKRRKNVIFVTHGAMSRGLQDRWVKLALVQRALRHRRDGNRIRRALSRHSVIPSLLQWRSKYRIEEDLWLRLLKTPAMKWLGLLQRNGIDPEDDDDPRTDDDPVPKAVRRVIDKLDTDSLYEALQSVPLHKSIKFKERVQATRFALNEELRQAWRACLSRLRIKLPLLILDEAHHLKNADTRLASLFRSADSAADAKELIDKKGMLHGVFERMLFLTATPFQLGHSELCSVLDRFDGINWASASAPFGGSEQFQRQLGDLRGGLDQAQQAAVTLDQAWGKLRPEDVIADARISSLDDLWQHLTPKLHPSPRLVTARECYERCGEKLRYAEVMLRPWVIRHLKPAHLPEPNTRVDRRRWLPGAAIATDELSRSDAGLSIEGELLLPFLLAARATSCAPESRPVFAEGLASSFEAFLETRLATKRRKQRDLPIDLDDDAPEPADVPSEAGASWYLDELDSVLRCDGSAAPVHPKLAATCDRVVQLWRQGEKVLVFCHYIVTGRVLRQCISNAIRTEILQSAAQQLGCELAEAAEELDRIGLRFFDDDSPTRRRCDAEVDRILSGFPPLFEQREPWLDIVRRNVRTPSFLARFFPLKAARIGEDAVSAAFDKPDQSGLTLRQLLEQFFRYLNERCEDLHRSQFLAALQRVQTGSHAVRETRSSFDNDELDPNDRPEQLMPNVRLVNGRSRPETRQRLMLTFNTPFYPEVLIASSVMAEGVDLHRNCRYVVHHDLCWNPSTLEQRTGRVDRIGAKAETCGQPINVYLPYVAATQDEKMYRVVMDRERWFSVVMGREFKTDSRTTETLATRVPFPEAAAAGLAFRLAVGDSERPADSSANGHEHLPPENVFHSQECTPTALAVELVK